MSTSRRIEFVRRASNGWLRETLRSWREEGIPQSITWFWFRDVCEEAEERGLIHINRTGSDDPFWWRMNELPFTDVTP